jgi:type VI secretion system Hcp family effector
MAQLYLKFEGAGAGADLEGTVVRDNYTKQIAVDSFGFGAVHEGGRPTAAYKGKSMPGNAAPSEISISKVASQESPGLLTACLKGTVIDKATLTMDGSSDDKVAEPIYKIEMELVVVKAVSWGGGSGGGEASIGEQISLSYDKITVTHVPSKKIMNYSASASAMK